MVAAAAAAAADAPAAVFAAVPERCGDGGRGRGTDIRRGDGGRLLRVRGEVGPYLVLRLPCDGVAAAWRSGEATESSELRLATFLVSLPEEEPEERVRSAPRKLNGCGRGAAAIITLEMTGIPPPDESAMPSSSFLATGEEAVTAETSSMPRPVTGAAAGVTAIAVAATSARRASVVPPPLS